jgi:hypothetical protein
MPKRCGAGDGTRNIYIVFNGKWYLASQFMRAFSFISIATISVCVLFANGCSQRSSPTPSGALSDLKDLGAVTLTSQVPRQFDLGGGKICTLTANPLTNGIEVEVVVMTTNADGSIQHWLSLVKTPPGKSCTVSLGDLTVGLTPTLKQ